MSHWKYQILAFVSTTLLLSGCNKIDDFVLGKDNTLLPVALKPIQPQFVFNEKWAIPVGGGMKNTAELKLNPVHRHNTIYTATLDGTVSAVNASSGRVLWSKKLSQNLLSGPVVDDASLVVTTDASSLIVLNPQNGEIRWERDLSGDSLAAPLLSDNRVFVKSIDGYLTAFNAKTGKKVWGVEHGAPHLILKASSSPIRKGDLILVGYSDGKLDAVEMETGRILWQRNIAYVSGGSEVERLIDIDADPVVRDDSLYLASYQGYIGELSIQGEEYTWRKPASIYKNFVIHDSVIYYVDSDSIIWALNRKTGHVLWKQEALKAHGITVPVVMGSHLLVGDKGGYIHGLNSATGQLVSRTQLDAAVYATPIVVGKNVYVLKANGKLSCFIKRS